MAMVVQHNMQAINANRMLGITTSQQSKSTEKLSSGYRINRAADDAAGLSISEKMRSQIRGLNKASDNAQDGISLVQTAEGALSETESILQRMRELSVQAANGTETNDDREAIQNEITQLQEEVTRISETTEFNTMKLLDGSLGKTVSAEAGSTINGDTSVFTAKAAYITGGVALATDAAIYATGKGATGLTQKDTLTVDGASFEIDWSKELSQSTQAALSGGEFAEDFGEELVKEMETVINSKIKEYNENTGASISDVSLKVNSDKKVEIYSGSTGAASSIKVESAGAAADSASLMGMLGLDSDGKTTNASPATLTSATTVQKDGYYTLNTAIDGDTAATYQDGSKDSLIVSINGQSLAVDTTSLDLGKNGVVDSTYTGALKTAIQSAITESNTNLNVAAGMEGYVDPNSIDVEIKQGALVITAKNGDQISLGGTVAEKLGIATDSSTMKQGKDMVLQIGANEGQTMSFNIDDMSAKALGIDGKNIDLSTQESAQKATTIIDEAIKKVSAQRSTLGAVQNRLEHTISNLDNISENTQSAESAIRDTDMAEEMVNYSKNNILAQAGQSMLAQANQSTQGVLSILG